MIANNDMVLYMYRLILPATAVAVYQLCRNFAVAQQIYAIKQDRSGTIEVE